MRYFDYKIAYRMDDIEDIRNGLFPFPKSLTIYPSEVCNLSCEGCSSESIHKKNGFMEFELFKKIIDDFSIYGRAVSFEGGGEPMLHPRISDMLKYVKSKGLKIGIMTNGTVYHKEMLLADWVRVSFYNSNPKVKHNIEKLMKNKTNTTIGVKFLKSKVHSEFPYIDADYVEVKNLRNHNSSLVENPEYVEPCGLTPLRAVVDYDGTFYPCNYFFNFKDTAIGNGVLSSLWGKPQHIKAIEKIKNCNCYDCALATLDLKTIKQADLCFI